MDQARSTCTRAQERHHQQVLQLPPYRTDEVVAESSQVDPRASIALSKAFIFSCFCASRASMSGILQYRVQASVEAAVRAALKRVFGFPYQHTRSAGKEWTRCFARQQCSKVILAPPHPHPQPPSPRTAVSLSSVADDAMHLHFWILP